MLYSFKSDIHIIGAMPGTASIEELSEINSVYAASPEFAIKHCGRLVENILNKVPKSYYDECQKRNLLPNIDVRVHRLYPGVYPAFPGWHCDAEYRETYFSQPDLERTPVSKTVVCTISSHADGVSNTEFLLDDFITDIESVETEQTIWKQVHDRVEKHLPNEKRKTWIMQDGLLTEFGNRTLHRARPAKVRGWRLFFRMSMWHKPYLGAEGKVSRQEQVYIVDEGQGW